MQSSVDSILRQIQKKNFVNKEDMRQILTLSDSQQEHIINKISKTRQKKLLDCLNELPYLDEQFNFPISRKVSINEPAAAPRKISEVG